MTSDEKFWSHVDKAGECWEWTGGKERDGYGQFRLPNGHRQAAHRYAWEWEHGEPVPTGLVVMHKCDNPGCVNPDHLQVGTHADNMQDRNGKGRQARGVRHGNAKLTPDDVRTMRALYAKQGVTQVYLSKRFGVARSHVQRILAGERWTDVM